MSLEDLGNFGEFVGAIAVVVSMIYLAMQVRRNTQSLDTLAFLGTPGGRLWWKGNRVGFTVSASRAIDDVLANHHAETIELSAWRYG